MDQQQTEEKIIDEEEISTYLNLGWRWKGQLSSGKFVVERDIQLKPIKKYPENDPRGYFKSTH